MDWQAILVITLVAIAVAYLGRRAWKTYRRPGCHEDCSACPRKDDAGTQGPGALVQIRLPHEDGAARDDSKEPKDRAGPDA